MVQVFACETDVHVVTPGWRDGKGGGGGGSGVHGHGQCQLALGKANY